MKKEKKKRWTEEKYKHKKSSIIVYLVLRFLVILCLIGQILHQDWNNVFLCVLTLVLFTIPDIIDKRLHIELPNTLEIIILLFIFSAEILGEIQNFYGFFTHWDTILHTINGFLCAAIGFSLIDILNRNEKFHIQLSPAFVALVAFCFSMTVGVLWEFFEYGLDQTTRTDTQKDTIVQSISSVSLQPEGKNIPVVIDQIDHTVVFYTKDGLEQQITIPGGYLDIGIHDTMKDLLVNLLGAVVFSIFGLLYIKNRNEYRFAGNFIPIMKKNNDENAKKV